MKLALRPIIQHYQFISQTLQLMCFPIVDETPPSSFHLPLAKLSSKAKVLRTPFYLVKVDTMTDLMQKSGFTKITSDIIIEIAKVMDILIESEG